MGARPYDPMIVRHRIERVASAAIKSRLSGAGTAQASMHRCIDGYYRPL
jgi:hypothetical protein